MGNDFIVIIHCLTYLAIHHENRYSSKDLAFNACSNPAIVRKLMSQAVKKGCVNHWWENKVYQWQGDPKGETRRNLLIISENAWKKPSKKLPTQPAL